MSINDTDNFFSPSFDNIVDSYYFDATVHKDELNEFGKEQLYNFIERLEKVGYADKLSDLTIEEGTSYKYSRISKDDIKSIYNNLQVNNIDNVSNHKRKNVKLSDNFTFDKEEYRTIDANKFNNTNSINFNTNIYINPKAKMGLQLFGGDYEYGLSIQNRKDLTPFIYYASENILYMLNNRFKVANKINFNEKYNEKILYAVIGAPFDDLYVFTDTGLYILDYDLRLKNRIELDPILASIKNDKINKNTIFNIHVISYNKNLYAVVGNPNPSGPGEDKTDGYAIIKFILNPENTEDLAKVNEYPNLSVVARELTPNKDYITNFITSQNEEYIQTKHVIKSIFVHNGFLYAVNYDIAKLSSDNDTVYGIIKPEANKEYDWYYMYNQSISKLFAAKASSKYAEFSSDNGIVSVANGPDGYFGLIRDINDKEAELTLGKRKSLEIYDKSKTKIYNYPLDGCTDLVSFDYYRYIDEVFEEHDVFVAILKTFTYITIFEYQIDNEKVNVYLMDDLEEPLDNFRNVIDSDRFIAKLNENKLYFNLCLNENNKIIHEWDLREAQEGWYNINVEANTEEAIFNIKINDKTVGKYNSETHPFFKAHKHTNTSIFNQTHHVGIVGKKHGATLNEILNGTINRDPYIFRNTKLKNTTLFNRNLEYYEYLAMRLNFEKINKLVLTLPCGIRNGIDEIIRYFKFAKPGAISNKVKINISGANGISLNSEKEFIRNSIIDAVKEADCLQNIDSINFI